MMKKVARKLRSSGRAFFWSSTAKHFNHNRDLALFIRKSRILCYSTGQICLQSAFKSGTFNETFKAIVFIDRWSVTTVFEV